MGPCEGCQVKPKGEYGLHDFCTVCGMDLCDKCMGTHPCKETADGKHIPDAEDNESEEGDALLVDS